MKSTIAQDTVRIPLQTSVKVIQDLGRLDEARVKIVLLEENINNYKALIKSYEKSEIQSKEIIANTHKITILCQDDLKALTKKYKTSVRVGRLYLVIAASAVAYGIYQSLK